MNAPEPPAGVNDAGSQPPPAAGLAERLARLRYFTDGAEAAKAALKIQYGREIGVGPVTALANVEISKGKLTVTAQLQSALIKRSGRYDYAIVKATDTECVLDFFESGRKVGTVTRTIEEARRANLLKKDVWRYYPTDLLFARAITRGVKQYCPDLLMGGAYTLEEIDGDVAAVEVEVPPVLLPPPQAAEAEPPSADLLYHIDALKQDLGIDEESWAAVLGKRGVSSAAQLSPQQAEELFKAMRHRAETRDLQAALEGKDHAAAPTGASGPDKTAGSDNTGSPS
jgi:hypothetical protein